MGKKFFNKWIILGFLMFISIANLLTFTIPLSLGNRISVNQTESTVNFTHLYQIKLQKGLNYTIIITTDPFWGDDYSITLYDSYLLISGKKVDSVSNTGERFEFQTTRSGRFFFKLNAHGFGDLIVRNGSYGSTAEPVEISRPGRAVLFFIPEIVLIPMFLSISLTDYLIRKRNRFSSTKSTMGNVRRTSIIPHTHVSLTLVKIEEERLEDLRSIIRRYKSISIDELVQLLGFRDRIALQDWLIDLPESIAFQIDNDMVFIPETLQTNTEEAKLAIQTLAKSLTQLQIDTCYYCGEPINDATQLCNACEKEILRCMVCKLPISFGEAVGRCALCDTKAHLNHFQEWLKVNGSCPHCRQQLPPEGIVLSSPTTKK